MHTLSPRRSRRYAPFFEAANDLRGFSSIAPIHYRSASKLLQQAENVCAGQQWKVCQYVLSAICLFHACLECYLNEELALALESFRDEPAAEELFKRCDMLQNDTFTRTKLHKFLDLYGIRERIETGIIENVGCLCDLRDRLYHYSPTMRPTNEYPEAAVVVLTKVGVEALHTNWTNLVSDLRVGAWAKDATERFVEMHHAVRCWPSPFSEHRHAGSWNFDYSSPPQ
jgi:hypothetical protein